MIKRKYVLSGIASLGVIVLMFFVVNYYYKTIKVEEVQHKRTAFLTEIKQSNFQDKIATELKKEGFQTTGMVIGIGDGGKTITIFMKNIANPKQTQVKTSDIVNKLSKQNKFGSFKVEIKQQKI